MLRRRFPIALALAGLLHALALGVVEWRTGNLAGQPTPADAVRAPQQDGPELDWVVDLEPSREPAAERATSPVPSSTPEAAESEVGPGLPAAARQNLPVLPTKESSATVSDGAGSPTASSSQLPRGMNEVTKGSEPHPAASPPTLGGAASGDAPPGDGGAASGGRALSLSALGLNGPSALVREGVASPSGVAAPDGADSSPAKTKVARAEAAVERSLAQGILDHDRGAGTGGGHAPVLEALQVAAFALAPLQSEARLVALADADGRVVSISVKSTNRDFDAWEKVARRALSHLTATTLPTRLGRPVQYVIDVDSVVRLPSGMAPGPGISLLGLPLKKKAHKDSGQVVLLDPIPKLSMVEIPNPSGGGGTVKVPEVQAIFTIFGTNLDPTDIGATARKVVRSRLVEQTVL